MSLDRTALSPLRDRLGRLADKVDGFSLRERAIIFATVAVLLFGAVNTWILNPEFQKQKHLSDDIAANRAKVQRIQTEIQASVRTLTDPDEERKSRLSALQGRLSALNGKLLDMQKGLVPPDKMPALLEDLLQHNAHLKLVSLKTLPVSTVGSSGKIVLAGVGTEKPSGAGSAQAESLATSAPVYTHGVEIVVQGGYLDMLNYMKALEGMPWQLFWGRARLDAGAYPDAKLTLTLYTLSLDKNWLNL